jgi:hypothetical protein
VGIYERALNSLFGRREDENGISIEAKGNSIDKDLATHLRVFVNADAGVPAHAIYKQITDNKPFRQEYIWQRRLNVNRGQAMGR